MVYRHLTRTWLYVNAVTALLLLATGLYWPAQGESGRGLL